MFDPTIYENLKVVLEGAVYDLDLSGHILVTNRTDSIDLATLSRTYAIRFIEAGLEGGGRDTGAEAEIGLFAGLKDLAGELLAANNEPTMVQESGEPEAAYVTETKSRATRTSRPGCELRIVFHVKIASEQSCPAIKVLIEEIWGKNILTQQELTYLYGAPSELSLSVRLDFQRKIDEDQIEDISSLLEHVQLSLTRLNALLRQ